MRATVQLDLSKPLTDVTRMAAEASHRREMLLAAYLAETGLSWGDVALVVHEQPGLTACWPDRATRKRTLRERWRALRRWLRDPRGRREERLVAEFAELGLVASNTALFVEHATTLKVYFAERRSLQVRCRFCRKRVALIDFDSHARKHHAEGATP